MPIVEEIADDVLIEIVDLDRATLNEASILRDNLVERIDQGYKNIVIDLSQCEFIDSTFLGVLVNTLKRVAKLNGDMKLVGFKPGVRSMFELTRLFRVFESFTDLQEAVISFRK